jgi:hypothetical protein
MVEAYGNLGVAYGAMDRHEEAAGAYLELLLLRPYDAKAYGHFAEAYTTLGREDRAAELVGAQPVGRLDEQPIVRLPVRACAPVLEVLVATYDHGGFPRATR